MRRLFIFILILLTIICKGYADDRSDSRDRDRDRDSYMDAYYETHNAENVDKRKGYGYPDRQQFDEPAPPHYGPPMYGPPEYMPSYPAPPTFPLFGIIPPPMFNIFDKLLLKLDIFTILKLVLKLVIFKKIVSFIALICLLLFIPAFKFGKGKEDGSRAITYSKSKSTVDERLNTLTQFAWNAFGQYSTSSTCNHPECNIMNNMLNDIDNKYSFQRLLETYTNEIN